MDEINEKIEVLFQKMDVRIPLNVALCGDGLHLKIPPKIVREYALETGDHIQIQMKYVRYGSVREIHKI